ncbi:outer membrane fimbrial usher protein [Proteus myxofaciens ATCC 19692]|uniref:Outer membrane fimbrial usher protein n=2 Tax=Proteus myxofaciens TaxID=184072 RepID=A0A198EWG5_9GAMM|nr:outer membrane fimbrial usher protein [Proteus myxofaciens ATCC 19692]
MSGIKGKGWIQVKWGDEEQQQCRFHYNIENEVKNTLFIKKEINCQ